MEDPILSAQARRLKAHAQVRATWENLDHLRVARSYGEYVDDKKSRNERPLPKAEWESRKTPSETEPGKGLKSAPSESRTKKLLSRANAAMGRAWSSASKSVQTFLSDPVERKKMTRDMGASIRKAAPRAAKAMWAGFRGEVKAIAKDAPTILYKLAREKRKPTKSEMYTLYGVGVYAAGTALAFSGAAPLLAAGKAFGHSITLHATIKAMSTIMDDVFLGVEAVESAAMAAGLGSKLPFGTGDIPGLNQILDAVSSAVKLGSETKGPEGEEEKFLDDLMQKFYKEAGKVIEGLNDKDIDAIMEHGVAPAGKSASLSKIPGGLWDKASPSDFDPKRSGLKKARTRVAGSPLVQLNLTVEGGKVEKVIPSGSVSYLLDNMQVKRAAAYIGRVAARKEAKNPQLAAKYINALIELEAKLLYNEQRTLGDTSELWVKWREFYHAGLAWVDYVIDNTAIPSSLAKGIEMAARVFRTRYGFGKGPKPSIAGWYKKNGKRFWLLHKAADWEDRSENDGLFQHGPFTIHNTVGASEKDLQIVKAIIDRAMRAIGKTELSGMKQSATGTIVLVGQIKRKNWAAWYMPAKDVIYLRPKIRGASVDDIAKHLIHEVCHRFYRKHLGAGIKKAWSRYHAQMSVPDFSVGELPEPGTTLSEVLKVNNKQVKVDSYDELGRAVLLDAKTNQPLGTVDRTKLRGWIARVTHVGKFPSIYAASDDEEHFCEAVAHKGMGSLKPDNLKAFNEIVLGQGGDTENHRLAAAKDRLRGRPKYAVMLDVAANWGSSGPLVSRPAYGEKTAGLKSLRDRMEVRLSLQDSGVWIVTADRPPTRQDAETLGVPLARSLRQFRSEGGLFYVATVDEARGVNRIRDELRGLVAVVWVTDTELVAGNMPDLFAHRTEMIKLAARPLMMEHEGNKVTYAVKSSSSGIVVSVYYGRSRIGGINAEVQRYPERLKVCGQDVWGLLGKHPEVEDTRSDRWVSPIDGEERTNTRALRVYKAYITDKTKHGLGIGKAMYKALISEWFTKVGPFLFMPFNCSGVGGTSKMAARVWNSLKRDLPSSGNVLAVVRKPALTQGPGRAASSTPAPKKKGMSRSASFIDRPKMSSMAPGYPMIRGTTHDSDGVPVKDRSSMLHTRPRYGISLAAVPRGDLSPAEETKFHADLIDAIQTGRPMVMPDAQTSPGPSKEASQQGMSLTAARYKNKKEVPKADGSGMTVYEYSEGQVQHRNREKAKRVEKLRGSIDSLRKDVTKGLKSGDEKTRLVALAVGLMDHTYERVGNAGSAKEGHFGVTGWQKKHISFSGGKATVKYVGKSGVGQTKTVTDKALVTALKAACEGSKDGDCVTGAITASDVNKYLKAHDITAKDIRGFHANSEVQARLKAIRAKGGKLPSDPKEKAKKLKEEFTQALEEAAEMVGHKATTLKSQYLVPGLERNYLERGGEVVDNLAKQGGSTPKQGARPIRLSPQSLKMIEVMGKKGGKTSMVNMNLLGDVLAALGWSLEENTGAVKLSHHEQFESHGPIKAWLSAHNAEMWGSFGTKEEQEIWFRDEATAAKAARSFWRAAKKAAKKGPTNPERGEIYCAEAGDVILDSSDGRIKMVTLGWFMGVPSYTVRAANGQALTFTPSVDDRGRVADASKMKISRFFTWGYKNGLAEAAQAYMAAGGADAVKVIKRERDLAIRSEDGTGSCPACMQNVKLTSRQLIMRHGWQVVGTGGWHGYGSWHTSSCFGHGYLPFELSKEGAVAYRAAVQETLKMIEKRLRELQSGDPEIRHRKGVIGPGHSQYAKAKAKALANAEQGLSSIRDDLRTLDARIAGWSQQPLPGSRTAATSKTAASAAERIAKTEARIKSFRAALDAGNTDYQTLVGGIGKSYSSWVKDQLFMENRLASRPTSLPFDDYMELSTSPTVGLPRTPVPARGRQSPTQKPRGPARPKWFRPQRGYWMVTLSSSGTEKNRQWFTNYDLASEFAWDRSRQPGVGRVLINDNSNKPVRGFERGKVINIPKAEDRPKGYWMVGFDEQGREEGRDWRADFNDAKADAAKYSTRPGLSRVVVQDHRHMPLRGFARGRAIQGARKVALVNLNVDGDKRDWSGHLSSLSPYEKTIVQDMSIHESALEKKGSAFYLRGRKVDASAVNELTAAGYLSEGEHAFRLSRLLLGKRDMHMAAFLRRATKSKGEREDEETRRLSRPVPTKKPPRKDLERSRIHDSDDNKDVGKANAENDKDLSLNFKKVGARHASFIQTVLDHELMRLAGKTDKLDAHQKGDYWEGKNGWRAWPPNSDTSVPAKDEGHAKALAEGAAKPKGEEGGEQGKGEEQADPKAEARQEREKARAKFRRESKKFDSSLEALLGGLDPDMAELIRSALPAEGKGRTRMGEEFGEHIDVLAEVYLTDGRGLSSEGMKDAGEILAMFSPPPKDTSTEDMGDKAKAKHEKDLAEAREKKLSALTKGSPEDVGKLLARISFAQRIMLNPKMVGGRDLAGRTKPADLKERASEAVRQYHKATPEIRAGAAEAAAKALSEMGEDDPDRVELDAIVDGLAVAAAANGESLVVDGEPLRPRMSKKHQALSKHLIKNGSEDLLFGSLDDFYGPKGRAAVDAALDTMSDDELGGFGAGSGFPELSAKLKDAKVSETHKVWIRKFLKRQGVEDMTTTQNILEAARKEMPASKGGKPVSADELEVQFEEALSKDSANVGWQHKIVKAAEAGNLEEVTQEYMVWRSKFYLDWLRSLGIELPTGHPEAARHRNIVETGETSILDEVLVAQSEAPK